MRSDFGKVIIDCRRGGGRLSLKKARKGRWRQIAADPERAPTRESMSMSRGNKYLCDRLSPLERYLAGQVGRPWDKVWSEICANIPADGIMQQHVRNHVFDFVLTTTMLVEDRICAVRWGTPEPIDTIRSYRLLLYVCPRTGLLKRAPRPPRHRHSKPAQPQLLTEDGRELERIDDVWYVWELRTVRVLVDGGAEKQQQRRRRQLSKKEVARLVPR